MQFEILNFRRTLNVAVKIRGISAFFDLILLKLHVRTSLNQFLVFVL